MKDKSGSSSKLNRLTLTPTDLHTFLRTRRSIRRFKPDLIPDSVIENILTTATYAPSAHHRQPWRFAVITEPSTKKKLADAMAKEFELDLVADSLPREEIKKKGSLNSVSLSLMEDGRYAWSVINRSNGIDNIRALYFRLYPERLIKTRAGRDS